MTKSLAQMFEAQFGTPAEASARAPSRVNLIGEHLDYNDGPVLPAALDLATQIAVGRAASSGSIEAYSAQTDQRLQRSLDAQPAGDWMDFVVGCAQALRDGGIAVPGLKILIDSDIPMGAGLSSSAALEVSILKSLRALLQFEMDDASIARLGQRVENDFVGMQCGLMDQMACSMAEPGRALFFDTFSGETKTAPLLAGHTFAIIHCGVGHQLTDGGYNQRRSESEAAAQALGIAHWREVSEADLPRIEGLEQPLARRARHIVTETVRTFAALNALQSGDAAGLGAMMTASHASQRDDYEVSVPEMDALVDCAHHHGALGARMTGGGFGGSAVSLIETAKLGAWRAQVLTNRPEAYWVTSTAC